MNLFEELSQQALRDEYFTELLTKLEIISANKFFHMPQFELESKELTDALRFADILSRSENPEAKNKAMSELAVA